MKRSRKRKMTEHYIRTRHLLNFVSMLELNKQMFYDVEEIPPLCKDLEKVLYKELQKISSLLNDYEVEDLVIRNSLK